MKYQIIGGLILLAIGYGAGRYIQPAKIVTKTETVTKTNTVVQDHIHTVTKTITLPGGKQETITTTDNNSVENQTTKSDTKSSTVVTNSKPQWKVQALAGIDGNHLSVPVYGVDVERRIIGPISAGLYGNNNKEIGLSLSLEF